MAVPLAGCGGLIDRAAPPTSSSSSTGPPTLTFYRDEALPWEALEKVYRAASGVELIPVAMPQSIFDVQGIAMQEIDGLNEAGIDCNINIPWIGALDGFVPLQDLLRMRNFDSSPLGADLTGALRTVAGVVAMPWSAVPLVLYYRPASFEAARVPLPSPGWTLVDLQQAVALLRAGLPDGTLILDGTSAAQLRLWATFVAARHSGGIGDGAGNVVPWDAGVAAGLADYLALQEVADHPLGVGPASRRGPNLTAAMWFAPFHPGDWDAARDGTVGIAACPTAAGTSLTTFYPMTHSINRGYAQVDRALDFRVWLTGVDGQGFVASQGWPPILRSLAAQTAWLPVAAGPTFDPAPFTAGPGQRWFPPGALWGAKPGAVADALGRSPRR